MSDRRPTRVMHILDTLGWGGSERLVWDIVRLSDPKRVTHRVVTFFPDGHFGPFVYAERLRRLGAYGSSPDEIGLAEAKGNGGDFVPAVSSRNPQGGETETEFSPPAPRWIKAIDKPVLRHLRRLPAGWKRPLVRTWEAVQRASSRVALYSPATRRIIGEYFRFRPDVVHVHGYHGFSYGLFLKLVFRRPLVDMVPAMFSQMREQGTGWLVDQYRRYHRFVDCFFLASGYKSQLLDIGVPEKKLFGILGTVDLEAVELLKAERERHRIEVRGRLGIPPDSLLALSVGRLDPSKGHLYALEGLPLMLERFPNLHWVVLGEGLGRREMETRSSELAVEPHAHLVGFEPAPLPFYAAADIYLRTPTMEGENISSYHAIAMGLPTVGFDTCNETDLIARLGHGLLVPNMDASALALAVCKILSLPDRGHEMGSRGMDYCRAQLDLQKHVDDFMTIYTALGQSKDEKPRGWMERFTLDV